jgi:adhesin transport system membrane fusion protein
MTLKYRDDGLDEDYMPAVMAAERLKERRAAPLLLYSCLAFFIIFLVWAHFSQIDEITKGEGKIIPSSQIQKIEHLEGGIIKEILVKEGDIVNKGDLLLRIDNTVAEARYGEGKTLYYRYMAAMARLRALIGEKELVIPPEVEKKAPIEAEDARRQYKSRLDRLHNAVKIATHELEQRQQEYNEFKGKAEELKNQYELLTKKIAIMEPLIKKGVEPEIALLDLQKEASQLRSEMTATDSSILRLQAAMDEANQKITETKVRFKAEDWNEFKDVSNRFAEASSSYVAEGDRSNRTEVRSPVRGIIKQLLITTIGGVIQSGQEIMEIVPLNDQLLIEAKINPQDIAFLHPGQEASIKITAYDFSIYGDLKAELVRISADTIVDKNAGGKEIVYYKAYLRTRGTKLSKAQKEVAIIPGMVASVDILTGKKTILQYLMKPLIKTTQTAMTER